MKKITISLIVLLASSLALSAVEEALLKVLVEKEYITKSEAARILREAFEKPEVEAAGRITERLSIGGTLQGQWNYFDADIDGAKEEGTENSFEMRRLQVATLAELPQGWEGKVVIDLANDNSRLDEAHIAKAFNRNLKGYIGYMKAPFSYEETVLATRTKTIERSALNRFFIDDLNWGARVTGLQLQQAACESCPFGYTLALSNIQQNESAGSSDYKTMASWARIYRTGVLSSGKELTVGADLAWLPYNAVKQYGVSSLSDAFPHALYANLVGDTMSMMVQFIGANVRNAGHNNGVDNSTDAYPYGITIMPSVKITPELEGVFSFSFIDSDGVGVGPSDATRSANVADTQTWNKYQEYYLGGNYYIHGDDIKLSLGLIYAKGKDRLEGDHGTRVTGSHDLTLQGLESRLQLLF